MYKLLRHLLFALDAELSHDLTLALLSVSGNAGLVDTIMPQPIADPQHLMGLTFANRVGLAAGLDKNARCVRAMQGLGFGFVEVGTVTPLAQPGNSKPRLFRLQEHEALINRMGFNNDGIEAMRERFLELKKQHRRVPIGINIGKNKNTSTETASQDYLTCMSGLAEFADYFTINLSSPNTPGLRDLQFGEPLRQLLEAITEKRARLVDMLGHALPLMVKLAPDMSYDDLRHVADQLVNAGIEGVIATNTTISRTEVSGHPLEKEAGGLSGAVIFDKSTTIVEALAEHLKKSMVIVGVGGINSSEGALKKLEAGADLVQIYSGFIYKGPSLIRNSADLIHQNLSIKNKS